MKISWHDGSLTVIRDEKAGLLRLQDPVLIDGQPGRVHRLRSCAAAAEEAAYLCTQVTLLRQPGSLVTSSSFGDGGRRRRIGSDSVDR